MSYLLPNEQTRDWGVLERIKEARALLSVRDSATRRNSDLTHSLDLALDQIADALTSARNDETDDERAAREQRYEDAYFADMERKQGPHPSESEMFPWGERFAIVRMRIGARGYRPYVAGRGYVIGHETGMMDFGGPESGPGPVEEATFALLKCDDGQTIKVYVGELQPDDVADENIALWGTP